MPNPIQIQPYTSFLGTEEGIAHIVNPQVFSPSDSLNVYMDKLGRIRRIGGTTQINNSRFSTDTGAVVPRVAGLFEMKTFASGTTTTILVAVLVKGSEYEFWTSADDGATWTFRTDLAIATADDRCPDFAQYKNILYLTPGNGGGSPTSFSGTAASAISNTQSPTPTATASSTTGPLSGTYKYKLVSMEADGTRHEGSNASTAETCSQKQIALSWTADADTDVIGYEVYRTTGTGTLYYFVGWVEGRTTVAYTDSLSDSTLIERRSIGEHGEEPPTGAWLCEMHGDRMWWGRTNDYPFRAWYSDIGRPVSVGTESWLDFADPGLVGDQLTCMWGNYEKKMVVFTEQAVWTVSGTGAVIGLVTDWTKKRSNARTGAFNHRVVAHVPTGARFRDESGQMQQMDKSVLAYLTPLGDIRIFDGVNDRIISNPVRDTLAGLTFLITDTEDRATTFCAHLPRREEVVWYIGSTQVVWNYRFGTWWVWGLPEGQSCLVRENGTLLVGTRDVSTTAPTSGSVNQHLSSANTILGSAITARWMTGTLFGRLGEDTTGREQALPAAPYTKRFRWADILARDVSGVTLTVNWYKGHGELASSQGSDTFSTVAGTGEDVGQHRIRLHDSNGQYMHDEGLRLSIGNSASTDAWTIEALFIGYQNLPGLYRRNQ